MKDDTFNVVDEIANERARQISEEGRPEDHDDAYVNGQLAAAAACYARDASNQASKRQRETYPHDWPWEDSSWKPKSPRRNLIRAAALIVAEVERFDRALEQSFIRSVEKDPGSLDEIQRELEKLPSSKVVAESTDSPQRWGHREELKELVFVAIGEASMCWESPGGAGAFDCEKANEIGQRLLAKIHDQMPAPAPKDPSTVEIPLERLKVWADGYDILAEDPSSTSSGSRMAQNSASNIRRFLPQKPTDASRLEAKIRALPTTTENIDNIATPSVDLTDVIRLVREDDGLGKFREDLVRRFEEANKGSPDVWRVEGLRQAAKIVLSFSDMTPAGRGSYSIPTIKAIYGRLLEVVGNMVIGNKTSA